MRDSTKEKIKKTITEIKGGGGWNIWNALEEIENCLDGSGDKKVKSGMYGEMPKVYIGKFSTSQMSDKEGEKDIWIQDEEGGEGGQFNGEKIQEDLQNLFDKWF